MLMLEKLHNGWQPQRQAGTEIHVYLPELPHLQADLLVNRTPVGMAPKTGVSPVSAAVIANCGAVVDVIYNPAETELLRLAKPGKTSRKRVIHGTWLRRWQLKKSGWKRRLDEKLIDKLLAQVAQLL